MTKPDINPNGTPATMLAKDYEAAHRAMTSAFVSLTRTAPNARDYYTRPGTMDAAVKEHDSRLNRVLSVISELDTLVGCCERSRPVISTAEHRFILCRTCGEAFGPSESIASDYRLCQDCFEAEYAELFRSANNTAVFAHANSRLTILTNGAAR